MLPTVPGDPTGVTMQINCYCYSHNLMQVAVATVTHSIVMSTMSSEPLWLLSISRNSASTCEPMTDFMSLTLLESQIMEAGSA